MTITYFLTFKEYMRQNLSTVNTAATQCKSVCGVLFSIGADDLKFAMLSRDCSK